MKMALLFRNSLQSVPFRQAMLSLVGAKGDELIISSGYFNRNVDTQFTRAIRKGFIDPNNAIVRVVGGKWRWNMHNIADAHCQQHVTKHLDLKAKCWECDFEGFVDNLNNCIAPIQVVEHNIPFHNQTNPNHEWHAKIALKILRIPEGDKVIGGLIGSSNLTYSAFNISTYGNWNNECDVFMWDENHLDPSIMNRFDDSDFALPQMVTVIPEGGEFTISRILNGLLNSVSTAIGRPRT
jgi:phosphatidylserine/phosphatidylglycerophosphate/cardiolipin synthase-like enzyme